jgi:hypothetical protein
MLDMSGGATTSVAPKAGELPVEGIAHRPSFVADAKTRGVTELNDELARGARAMGMVPSERGKLCPSTMAAAMASA